MGGQNLKEFGIPRLVYRLLPEISICSRGPCRGYSDDGFPYRLFLLYHLQTLHSYFTVRASEFDAGMMLRTGRSTNSFQELKRKGNEASTRERASTHPRTCPGGNATGIRFYRLISSLGPHPVFNYPEDSGYLVSLPVLGKTPPSAWTGPAGK